MNWFLEQALGILLVSVILLAVVWELDHLVEWAGLLSNDPVHFLRVHAYTYVRWMFGTDFGWIYGE